MMRTGDGEWTIRQVTRDGVDQFRMTDRHNLDVYPVGFSKITIVSVGHVERLLRERGYELTDLVAAS
jgi:hypothetical protein